MAKKRTTGSKSSRWKTPLTVLQLVTGAYLLVLGVSELVAYTSELNQFVRSVSQAFGGSGNVMTVIVAILEIVAGALLVWALFGRIDGRVVYVSTMVIAGLWVLRILVLYVLNDPFEPTGLVWLADVTGQLIPGLVIWAVGSRYN